MTILLYRGDMCLECEDCPETTSMFPSESGWDEMIYEAKVAGWEIKLVNGRYEHRCPDCVDGGEGPLARAQRLFNQTG